MKFLGPDSRGAACLESDRWRARFLLGQIDCPTYFLYICVGGGAGVGSLRRHLLAWRFSDPSQIYRSAGCLSQVLTGWFGLGGLPGGPPEAPGHEGTLLVLGCLPGAPGPGAKTTKPILVLGIEGDVCGPVSG
jgi:hypothetical protein